MTQQQVQTPPQQARGWDHIVSLLHAAPDARTFFQSMLDLQCKVVAAEYGALWQNAGNGDVRAVVAWPNEVAQSKPDSPLIKILAEAASSGFKKGRSHVLRIDLEDDGSTAPVAPGVGAHVFVTAMKDLEGRVAAVTTVVADIRDPDVIKTTLPLRELIAGMYAGFASRLDAEGFKLEADQVRKAMSLLAVSQEGDAFDGASLNLVNELARQLRCTRVSLGWVKGQRVKLIAMSDTENLKRHSDAVANLELAMAECLDQEHPIVYPTPTDGEPLLQHAVVHSHRRVTGEHPNRHVLSVPLRKDDEWVGVLTLERPDTPFDATTIKQIQLIADVLAPHLADRKAASRWLVGHVWHSVEWAASYLVGPKHVGWKLLSVVIFAALVWVALGSLPYKVSAGFTLESESKRVVPAPYDGDLENVFVKPGDKALYMPIADAVAAGETDTFHFKGSPGQAVLIDHDGTDHVQATLLGPDQKPIAPDISGLYALPLEGEYTVRVQPRTDEPAGVPTGGDYKLTVCSALAQFNASEYKLQLVEAQKKLEVTAIEYDRLIADSVKDPTKIADAKEAAAQILQLQARIDLLSYQIDQATIKTPIDGVVISGSWQDKVGGVVKQGDQMFEVAPLTDIIATMYVDERDIDEVREAWGKRSAKNEGPLEGWLSTRSEPDISFKLHVERIVPMATPKDSANVFEVRCNIEDPADWLRPGMEGIGRIDIGSKRIYWMLSHRMVDAVRLWTWLPW
jgi:GAF domain-containing protein